MPRLTFSKNNILFCQDFVARRGIPEGIEFDVTELGDETIRLIASGHGGNPFDTLRSKETQILKGVDPLKAVPNSP